MSSIYCNILLDNNNLRVEDEKGYWQEELKNPVHIEDVDDCEYHIQSQFRIPNTFYQISSFNGNSTLIIQETNGVTPLNNSITIPDGNYKIDDLTSDLTLALNTSANYGATYVVGYDSVTGLVKIEWTGGTQTAATLLSFSNGSTINNVIGFQVDSDTTIESAGTEGDSVANVNHIGYIKVIIRNIATSNTFDRNGRQSVVQVCHLTGDRFDNVIYTDNNDLELQLSSMEDLHHFEIIFKDANNNTIQFNGGYVFGQIKIIKHYKYKSFFRLIKKAMKALVGIED